MSDLKNAFQYSQISSDIQVSVIPFYLEEESTPAQSNFVWAYQVRIENQGSKTVQLKNRTWLITDERGQTEMVEGEGVVGEQPIFKPGGGYEYTSFVSLHTPSGMMRGIYEMIDEDTQASFKVSIPLFSLDIPGQVYSQH